MESIRALLKSDDLVKILVWGIAAFFLWLLLIRPTIIWCCGVEQIGHYFEKSEYTAYYYVNLFPSEDHAKNYRLLAELFRTTEDYGGYSEDDPGGSVRVTHLNKLFFPNGGFLQFEDCELELRKRITCPDHDDREWSIELTDQQVRSPS